MPGFSDYLESKILNWLKGTAFGTAPGAVYIGLFSSDPTDAGSGTEVTTTVRPAGRVAVTFGTVGNGTMSNSAAVDFGTAAAGATISHFGLHDATTAGNLLMSGALSSAQSVSAGNEVTFPVGAIVATVE